jgi:hypothetical protein
MTTAIDKKKRMFEIRMKKKNEFVLFFLVKKKIEPTSNAHTYLCEITVAWYVNRDSGWS